MSDDLDRALQALRTRRPDLAAPIAADVLKSNPDSMAAARILGRALVLQGRYEEAIDPLQRAAEHAADPMIEALLGRALAKLGRTIEAVAQWRLATRRRPAFAVAFLELGEHLGNTGNFDEGLAVFEDGLALMPEADILRMGLGYLHLRRNDRSAARQLFSQVRVSPSEGRAATLALAGVMALDGEHAAAADLYQRALESRPNDDVTRINHAKCLLEMGERDAGEAGLRTAARSAPAMVGPAMMAIASTPHGRLFLRPSAAREFLGV